MTKPYYMKVKNGIIKSINKNVEDPVESKRNAMLSLSNDITFKNTNKQLYDLQERLAIRDKSKQLQGIDLIKAKADVIKLKKQIQNMINDSIINNIIYMNLPNNCIGIDTKQEADEILSKLDTVKQNECLLLNGLQIVINIVGKKYWTKDEDEFYTEYSILEVGEDYPGDCILPENLTYEDKEKIRLQSMTDEELDKDLYNRKFGEFLIRIFEESSEFSDYEKDKKVK